MISCINKTKHCLSVEPYAKRNNKMTKIPVYTVPLRGWQTLFRQHTEWASVFLLSFIWWYDRRTFQKNGLYFDDFFWLNEKEISVWGRLLWVDFRPCCKIGWLSLPFTRSFHQGNDDSGNEVLLRLIYSMWEKQTTSFISKTNEVVAEAAQVWGAVHMLKEQQAAFHLELLDWEEMHHRVKTNACRMWKLP